MKILILEDTVAHQVRLETTLNEIARDLNVHLDYEATGKLSEFETQIQSEDINQLYFLDLDIHGNEKQGLEIAKKIRAKNPYALLVFVTTHSESAPLTFKYRVSPLDFIDKDWDDAVFKKRIQACVEYALEVLSHGSDKPNIFQYSHRNHTVTIPYHEIYFITTTGSHKLGIFGKNIKKDFYGVMNDIMAQDTEHRFMKVNRGYIVNLENVVGYDRKTKDVIFHNDIRCPISRLHVRKLLDYLKKREQEKDVEKATLTAPLSPTE